MKYIRILILELLRVFFRVGVTLPRNMWYAIRTVVLPYKRIIHEGSVPLGGKICVFASYPASGIITECLRHYIKSLHELGYAIIFVSNLPINGESLQWLERYCSRIALRENFGRDFGAYKFAILKYEEEIRNASELLIANDSVTGPIAPLDHMFEIMTSRDVDMWGTTESYSRKMYEKYHLASYFLVLRPTVFTSTAFWDFWHKYRLSYSRVDTIEDGEIEFTFQLINAEFKLSSYIGASEIFEFIRKDITGSLMFLHPHLVTLALTCATNRTSLYTQLLKNLVQRFLYTDNHNVRFAKILLMLGSPFIKRDLFSRCHYYRADFALLLEQKVTTMSANSILGNMRYDYKPGLISKILYAIGEK